MKGFEGGVNMTHNRARMSDPHDHRNQTIKGGEAVQDRSKTADLLSSCLQDTQKKTDLQWSERPNMSRYEGLRPVIRWMSLAILMRSTGVTAAQPADPTAVALAASGLNPVAGAAAQPDPMSTILTHTPVIAPINVSQLGMPHIETQNYTTQLALPPVVIDYQGVAVDVWSNQLNVMAYFILFALLVVGVQGWWQRQLDRGFAGLVIIFALGFALLMVRVKLAA
ncbi:MAG: hypothetical protein RL180_480 [Pseudomonadota bacterium]|jgi:hypothetical protein